MSETPTSREGLQKYDDLEPLEAVTKAWHDAGHNPEWHHSMKENVRRWMPVLARALDRLS